MLLAGSSRHGLSVIRSLPLHFCQTRHYRYNKRVAKFADEFEKANTYVEKEKLQDVYKDYYGDHPEPKPQRRVKSTSSTSTSKTSSSSSSSQFDGLFGDPASTEQDVHSHYHDPLAYSRMHKKQQQQMHNNYQKTLHSNSHSNSNHGSKPMYSNNREKVTAKPNTGQWVDKDHMTMNEPEGPELKYHELKKLKDKRWQQQEEDKANQDFFGYKQPKKQSPRNFKPKQNEQQMDELWTEKPAYKVHNEQSEPNSSASQESFDNMNKDGMEFKQQQQQQQQQQQTQQPQQQPQQQNIDGEEQDSEFTDFYRHNNTERLNQFFQDRDKYGNQFPDAETKAEHEAKFKEEEKKKEEERKAKEKKNKPLTQEEVDQNARKYIKQFMFKIHPDFFHQDVAKRTANMNALQVLNAFLDVIRTIRDPTKTVPKDKIPLPFTISFFLKDTPKAISATFHLPKLPADGAISAVFVELLRKRSYEGLADLISKAKIEIDPEDKWIVEGTEQQVKRDFAHSRLPKHWRPIGWSPSDQDYGLVEIFLEHYASSKQRVSPFTRHQEEKIAMFVKDFFFFDSLTHEEIDVVMQNFNNNIHLLNFDRWNRVPVVFSTRRGCERLRPYLELDGFLVFPSDFTVEEANIIYMKVKLPGIKERREALVAQAKQEMLEVEAMKEQLKLALNPRSVTIETETVRETRKQRLATSLIRASRAADIELGNKSNSSLQHDYYQRETDAEFLTRRAGKFTPTTLEQAVMLPPVEVKNFDVPTYLPPAGPGAPAIAAGGTSRTTTVGATSPTVTVGATSPTATVDASSIVGADTTSVGSTESSNTAVQPVEPAALFIKKEAKEIPLSEYTRKADISANIQPIQSITPKKLDISSDETISGPSLGLGRDAVDSPTVRNGYLGLVLDLEEDDRLDKEERAASRSTALQPHAEKPTGVVSGDFHHTSSALYCLKHLVALASTRIISERNITAMKTDFPWFAIKIIVSDHYHLDMANPAEPTLYVPCYFDEATLRKFMEAEGGSKLKKLILDLEEKKFMAKLTNRIRNTIGVHSVKLGTDVPRSKDHLTGLLNLDKYCDIFTTLGSSLGDLQIIVADTFALSNSSNYPKLYIPFDCTAQELREYLESETVPERYKQVMIEKAEARRQLHQEMLYDQYGLYDNEEDDEMDEEEYEEEGGEEEDEEDYHDNGY